MRFYGNGILWDPETDSMLCRFKNGALESDDKVLNEKLIRMGILHEENQNVGSSARVRKRKTISGGGARE